MATYKLKDRTIARVQKGEKLIQVGDFVNEDKAEHFQEGATILLNDANNRFLAKMLVGRQNKGLGWVFTQEIEEYWSERFVIYLLEDAIDERETFFANDETTAFRLFNGEGDGIGGLTIDWYATYLHINWYSEGLHQYRQWFIDGLIQLLPEVKGIYETYRFTRDVEEAIQLAYGEEAPQPLIIKENNINYAVYLGESWMTGIFLDQRDVREFIRTQAQGMRVLNLFSYTGAFSVSASVGGAQHTVSVDLANRSLVRTEEQFEINDLKAEQPEHEIRVMDVFDYISYAKKNKLSFDMVICDPPSFARSKKYIFSVEKDYPALAEDLFTLTAVNGLTIISTNHSGYSIDMVREDLLKAADKHRGQFHLIQQFVLPEDFPTSEDQESNYLKVFVFYRAS